MITNKQIANVKRAVVTAAMKEGYSNIQDILDLCDEAVFSIGKNSAAAYKAWATMDKQTIQSIKNRTSPARKHIR